MEEVVVTGYRENPDEGWSVVNSYAWQDHAVYDKGNSQYIRTVLSNREANIQWTKQLSDLADERTQIMRNPGFGEAQGNMLTVNEY